MNLLDKRHGTVLIVHAKGLAIVVAEVKLVHVALQMLLAHALVNASKTALQDREVALNRVRRHVAANVLFAATGRGLMGCKLAVKLGVPAELVRMDRGVALHVGANDGLEVLSRNARDVEGAHCAVALDQREDLLLVFHALLALRVALVAPVGLISFNHLSSTTELAGRCRFHASAQTVGHEPRGLVGHAKHALKLLAAHAFLGRADQVVRVDPLMEGDFGVFKYRAYRDRELGSAVAAEPQAGTSAALAGGLRRDAAVVFHPPTVWADRTIRPPDRLKVRTGGVLVMEARFSMDGGVIWLFGQGLTSLVRSMAYAAAFVKYILALQAQRQATLKPLSSQSDSPSRAATCAVFDALPDVAGGGATPE
jgi:hypothetical protein